MRPAESETEFKSRLYRLKPGQWLCPCGATIMGRGSNRGWHDFCPYCKNVPSSVSWNRQSQAEACTHIRNKSRARVQKAICQCCGVTFIPTRSDARFCTNACRQKAYRIRRE